MIIAITFYVWDLFFKDNYDEKNEPTFALILAGISIPLSLVTDIAIIVKLLK